MGPLWKIAYNGMHIPKSQTLTGRRFGGFTNITKPPGAVAKPSPPWLAFGIWVRMTEVGAIRRLRRSPQSEMHCYLNSVRSRSEHSKRRVNEVPFVFENLTGDYLIIVISGYRSMSKKHL